MVFANKYLASVTIMLAWNAPQGVESVRFDDHVGVNGMAF